MPVGASPGPGAPYASFGSVTKVANSIKDGRPAILGLGWYWHYPAYGARARDNNTGNVVWQTQTSLQMQYGLGGSSAQWHNANSTWFGTDATYW